MADEMLVGEQARRANAAPVTFEAVEGSVGSITGYAAVFNQDTLIRDREGSFRERIAPTAFDDILGKEDVVANFNHNVNNLLGRTSNGTLRLSRDAHGLKYTIDMPDTTLGRDVLALVQRGDLNGSSFRFAVPKGGFTVLERGKNPGDPPLLRIDRISRLMDVGPVTEPAYEGTSVTARSVQEAISSLFEEQEAERLHAQQVAADVQAAKPADVVAREAMRAQLDTAKAWRK